MKEVVRVGAVSLAVVGALFSFVPVSADQYTGTSYKINGNLGTSTGDMGSSDSYKLESTSGESIVGKAAGGSYKMFQGYISDPTPMMRLSVDLAGLVASYPLNETSGNYAYDFSTYRTHGNYQNGPTTVTGKVGDAVTLNGTSQVVAIGNNAQTQLSASGTIEVWVKSSTGTASMGAVVKASNYWLGISYGKAGFYDWTSGLTTIDSATTITDGNWHHLVATLEMGVTDGSTLYVDGVAKNTFTWTPASQGGALAIGGVSFGGVSFSQFFNGSIDHVKIFNRKLSASEVKAEYAAQNAGSATGLTLGEITPGVSSTADLMTVVATNSNDYTLSLSQNHDLQQASHTIPAIGALITSPAAWSEGATKGLGFTLVSGPNLDGKWGSGANYASLPNTATTFYMRSGAVPTSSDTIALRLRADTTVSQPSGDYTNVMTITGTTLP